MYAKEFRQKAQAKMTGNWGTFAIIMLVIMLLESASSVLVVVPLLIAGPFAYSVTSCSLKVCRGQKIDVENFLDGFRDFARSFVASIINGVLIALWSLLLVVPGIIKSLEYSMTYYIMLDDPKISANDARKKSMEMMQGHRWELFCLLFSFVGWLLLSILTLGILLLWVQPYMEVAVAEFYRNLKGEQDILSAETPIVEAEARPIK